MDAHPVQLVVEDDLRRSRLTVFFRYLLAIPHLIWLFLWTLLTVVLAIVTWAATLVRGSPPAGLHGLMSSYVRYQVHLSSYLALAANPYPPFNGEEGTYPIDVKLPQPAGAGALEDARSHLPRGAGAALSSAFGGSGSAASLRTNNRSPASTAGGALVLTCAVLGWFAGLFRGPHAERPARRRRVRHRLHARRCSPTCCSSPTATRTPTRRRCSPASSVRPSTRSGS